MMKTQTCRQIVLSLSILLLLAQAGWGQGSEPCWGLLNKALEKLNDPSHALQGSKRFSMECELVVAPKDSVHQSVSRQAIRVVMGSQQLYYESPEMTMLSDHELTATIVKSSKLVVLSGPLAPEKQKSPVPSSELLQQQALEGSQLTRCSSVRLPSGGSGQLIELSAGKSNWGKYNIASIRYLIDPASARIIAVRIRHTAQSPLAYTEVHYKKIDFAHPAPALSSSVRKLVLESNNTLKKIYSGYQLIQPNPIP